MTDAATDRSQATPRALADRAAAGDRAALETMFAQFLPRGEELVDGDYLGKYGLWWFGTRTFVAMTHRRVSSLRVRKFGHVTYEDALLEHVSTGSVRQPSRLLFYFLLAAVLVPSVAAGAGLFPVVGAFSLVLPALGLLLLLVVVRLYRAFVKSGLLFWVREGVPVYAYCDRGRLGRANVLFRVFGEQRDRFLPTESRPAPAEAERSEPASGGTLLQRARAGDQEALETMFRQFLPQTDAILMAAFLGTQGLWGIGTHSFACVTQRRVVSLRVSTFGRVVFQESLSANVNGGRVHQPSQVWLYLLSGAWVLWPVFAAASGPAALVGLLFTIPSLPLVIRFYHGRVKSGALLHVRESPPNYLFCDRGKLSVANALYRLATERGQAGVAAAATGPPPAPAVIRPGRAGVVVALALCGLLLAAGAGAAIWATRGGDGLSTGDFLEGGSLEIEDIEIVTEDIEIVTDPGPDEQSTSALLAHVPPEIAAGCSSQTPAQDGALEQAFCEADDGTTLVYTQFDTAEAMEASYDFDASSVGRDVTPDGWCTNGIAGEGEWTSGNATVGRLVCSGSGDFVVFTWTDDEQLILVQALRSDGDWDAMNETWDAAGPES